MASYRCMCCENDRGQMGFQFEAVAAPGKPVQCPKCGEPFLGFDFSGIAPGSNMQPRGQGHVVEVAVVHFEPARINLAGEKMKTKGRGHPACDPTKRTGDNGTLHCSGVPVAVSCPACRATDLWKQAATEAGIPVAAVDYQMKIDPATGKVTMAATA